MALVQITDCDTCKHGYEYFLNDGICLGCKLIDDNQICAYEEEIPYFVTKDERCIYKYLKEITSV